MSLLALINLLGIVIILVAGLLACYRETGLIMA